MIQTASTAVVIGLLADLLFVLAVVRRGMEQGDRWVAVWALVTLLLPFIGYAIYMAASSRDEDAPDMSVITRELRGGRIRPAAPQPQPQPESRRPAKRPRNYF